MSVLSRLRLAVIGVVVLAGVVLVVAVRGVGAPQAPRPVGDVRGALAESPAPSPTATATAIPSPTTSPLPSASPTPLPVPLSGPTHPGGRYSAPMAYDGARRDVVMFGGVGGADETWTWDGRWTLRHPAHSPGPRAYSEMAYDPVHRQVVLFGGIGLSDTWLWDGTDWTEAAPTFVPQQTIEEGMTFSSATGTVLMYSGGGFGSIHVYSWDGRNWTDLPFTGGPPSSAFQGGFSADPVRGVVVLLADDINQQKLQHWEFDGRTWTHRDVPTPPVRALVQTVTDQRDHTIVMFGGVNFNDTWTWDGTQWTQQQPRHSPPQRSSTGPMPSMAYDAARGEVVVFGGLPVMGPNVPLDDTWTWNGRDWRQR